MGEVGVHPNESLWLNLRHSHPQDAAAERPKPREDAMTLNSSRRQFLAGSAAAAGAAAFPMPAVAQNAPMKVGLLTVKTGPLAAGGQHAEEGITSFLKDKNFTLSGRKIELLVADTGGSPAGAKTKAQELVERDKVNVVLGPFAA